MDLCAPYIKRNTYKSGWRRMRNIHVFEKEGEWFAYDIKSGLVLKLNETELKVLKLSLERSSIEDLSKRLSLDKESCRNVINEVFFEKGRRMRNIHVFEKEGEWFAYDIKSGLVLKLNETELKVLKLSLERSSIEDLSKRLSLDKESCRNVINEVKRRVQNARANMLTSGVKIDIPMATHLTLMISQVCNLACKHCYADGGSYGYKINNHNRFMDIKTAKRAIDLATKFGLTKVWIFGGEPLLNFQLIKKVLKLYEEKVTFGLVTNATLITDEVADFLREHSLHVAVSIDGPASVHNLIRVFEDGGGSHDATVSGINRLIERDIDFSIEACYSKRYLNKMSVCDQVNYLSKFTNRLILHPVFTTYKWGRAKSEDILNEEEYYDYMMELIDCTIAKKSRVKEAFIAELIYGIVDPWKNKRFICEMLARQLYVFPNGDIYPCFNLVKNTFKIGNIWENQIDKTLKKRWLHLLNKYFTLEKLELESEWYKNITNFCVLALIEHTKLESSEKYHLAIDFSDFIEHLIWRLVESLSKEESGSVASVEEAITSN